MTTNELENHSFIMNESIMFLQHTEKNKINNVGFFGKSSEEIKNKQSYSNAFDKKNNTDYIQRTRIESTTKDLHRFYLSVKNQSRKMCPTIHSGNGHAWTSVKQIIEHFLAVFP